MRHNHPPKIKKTKNRKFTRDKFFERLHKWEGQRADKNLKVCPTCGMVWEIIKESKDDRCRYYHDFPTYGKIKVICDRCYYSRYNKIKKN
tara:strand:+ start:3816 stop:4085 length:270 start_codon:yes stop_codon:yes gene_type:complete